MIVNKIQKFSGFLQTTSRAIVKVIKNYAHPVNSWDRFNYEVIMRYFSIVIREELVQILYIQEIIAIFAFFTPFVTSYFINNIVELLVIKDWPFYYSSEISDQKIDLIENDNLDPNIPSNSSEETPSSSQTSSKKKWVLSFLGLCLAFIAYV